MNTAKRIARAAEPDALEGEPPESWRGLIIGLVIVAALLLAAMIAGLIYLFRSGPAVTENVRDIVIIVVAFEFMIVGLALIILVVQLARLVNLLQNELRPVIDSASETVNTLRGTARFLSDNLAGPVVKANAAIAGLRKAIDLFNFGRRR
jgi:hypothetical protein